MALTKPSSALVTYNQGGTGAVATTVQTKLRESVSVKDFGAVGDGVTDDTATIQAAIDAVAAAGSWGVVTVPPGTYIFTSILVKTGVTFRGEGGVLKLKNNTCTNASTSYYLINNLGHTNVTYENLIIDGNRTNNTLWLVADAITATGSSVVVRGCRITNTPDSGVMFSDAPNGICEGNTIITGGDLGIYVNGSEGGANNNTMLVTGNVITGFPYGGIGIKRSTENTIVSNNLITSCGNGITVEDFGAGTGGAPDHLLITGNVMKDIGYPYRSTPSVAEVGVTLNGCSNVMLTNNKIQNVSGIGILLSGTVDSSILGNSLLGYTASPGTNNRGISSEDRSGVTPARNTVIDNTFQGFAHYGAYFNTLLDCIVNNNIFKSSGSGLRINAGCDSNTISFNRLNGTPDLELYAGADANILQYNYQANAATEWQKAGHIRSTAFATPVGNITPNYPGQLCWITTAGPKIFVAYGITNTEWVQIG